MSKDGKSLAAWCEDTSEVIVFDVQQRKLLRKIKSTKTAMFDDDQILLSPDSKFLLFKVEGTLVEISLYLIISIRFLHLLFYFIYLINTN